MQSMTFGGVSHETKTFADDDHETREGETPRRTEPVFLHTNQIDIGEKKVVSREKMVSQTCNHKDKSADAFCFS